VNDNHRSLNELFLYIHFHEIVVHNVLFHIIELVNLDLVKQLLHITENEEKELNCLMIYDLMNSSVVVVVEINID
jgi:hypothetical protein